MRYAHARCTFSPKPDNPAMVVIQGPYLDDSARMRTVAVFKEDLDDYYKRDGPKRHVQTAFPYLSADDREFLISGMSPEGFDAAFPDE